MRRAFPAGCVQLVLIQSDSGGLESRLGTLVEEVNSLRALIAEKDTLISKLRVEVRESSEKASKSSTLVRSRTNAHTIEHI